MGGFWLSKDYYEIHVFKETQIWIRPVNRSMAPYKSAQTWGSYQHAGLAAVEAVQQRLGADVVIEQRHRGTEFSQGQPGEYEGGLVPHEERHGVASPVARPTPQRAGNLIAPSVGVLVRVALAPEHQEQLVWIGGGLLQETVQHKEEGSPPPPRHERHQNPQQLRAVNNVLPHIGAQASRGQGDDEDTREGDR